jgi:hypothetical protein
MLVARWVGVPETAAQRVWGTGIGVVMLLAVGPYPITAFFVDDEIPHRIHNIVGALQYLPLWAVPVLMLTWGRDATAAWRVALVSSCAMFAVGAASGDLVPSLSWMPLVTLLPLRRRGSWGEVRIPAPADAISALLIAFVAARHVPDLVELQRLDMPDSHSTRFHFSGMAAAYLALCGAVVVNGLFSAGRPLRLLSVGSVLVVGAASLVWTNYESALPARDAWLLVIAAVLTVAATKGTASTQAVAAIAE